MSYMSVIRKNPLRVAREWKKQYFCKGAWLETISGDSEDVYWLLLAAKGRVSAINAAIGNESWTRVSCTACGRNRREVVQCGEFQICPQCLDRAQKLLKAGA